MVALEIVRSWMILPILTIASMRIVWSDRWKGLPLFSIFPRFALQRRRVVPKVALGVENEGRAMFVGVDWFAQGREQDGRPTAVVLIPTEG